MTTAEQICCALLDSEKELEPAEFLKSFMNEDSPAYLRGVTHWATRAPTTSAILYQSGRFVMLNDQRNVPFTWRTLTVKTGRDEGKRFLRLRTRNLRDRLLGEEIEVWVNGPSINGQLEDFSYSGIVCRSQADITGP